MKLHLWGMGTKMYTICTRKGCINFIRAKVEDNVHFYFKTDTWKNTFVGMIHVIPSPNNWPIFPHEDLLQPPQIRRLPGRPLVQRRREAGEPHPKTVQFATKKCSRCGSFGHNVRSCKGEAVMKTHDLGDWLTVKLL